MAQIYPEEYLQDFKGDQLITDKELLTQKYNFTRSVLLARACEYFEAKKRYEDDPSGFIVIGRNPHSGQDEVLSYASMVNKRIKTLIEAISVNATFKKMLAEVESGAGVDFYIDPKNIIMIDDKHRVTKVDPKDLKD